MACMHTHWWKKCYKWKKLKNVPTIGAECECVYIYIYIYIYIEREREREKERETYIFSYMKYTN